LSAKKQDCFVKYCLKRFMFHSVLPMQTVADLRYGSLLKQKFFLLLLPLKKTGKND